MNAPLVVVGDALLDVDVHGRVDRVCPDAPAPVLDAADERARPGGAALTALLAAHDGARPVRLVAALPAAGGPDADRLAALLEGSVDVVGLPVAGTPAVKTRMLAGGRPIMRLDRGGLDAPDPDAPLPDAVRDAIAGAGVLLVSDYGRGVTAHPGLRAALADAARRVPVVWDPHPRGAAPVDGVDVVTPNLAEARSFAGSPDAQRSGAGPLSPDAQRSGAGPSDGDAQRSGAGPSSPDAQRSGAGPSGEAGDWLAAATSAGETLRRRWGADAVAVTAGERGAVLCAAAGTSAVPARPAPGGDACGAGDRFAATVAVRLGAGAAPDEAVAAAVAAAGAFVAGGGAGAVDRDPDGPWHVPGASAPAGPVPVDDVEALLAAVRARGGRVVATGGCFDLLHAGHARTLAAARSLGGADGALVVCLNSDDSVRRLKGPTRPIVGEDDRAELLAALGCVDAVVTFAEDDPRAVLDRLRPDVWVKGGDYAADDLAETPLVRSWGGEVVAVPYHAGRSSTRLVTRLDSLSPHDTDVPRTTRGLSPTRGDPTP